jgi:hypothetical protein
MESTREELQRALATIERRGRGRPYPRPLLEQLLAYTVARRRQGATLLTIGQELGMSWRTLSRWVSERALSVPRETAAAFHPVQIASRPRSEVIVRGPHGIVIEGLDVDGVAELVKRLGR